MSGVCPPVLDDARDVAARFALARDDGRHVFEGQRLEVEAVDRVVVGRDRLRVAVHHHRLEALLAEGKGGVAAAIVELDSLADAVRTAAEDDHLRARRRLRLALFLARAVHIGRVRLEFRRAGIDPLVRRAVARLEALARTASSSAPSSAPSSRSPIPARLSVRSMSSKCRASPTSDRRPAQLHNLRELREEPRDRFA